ncbi:Arc family DNA-binding protein [Dactylosporangium sp. NPDC000555]|uniref:Arc family DNA-binding protein n=1 Tax=Dactylosporangium sp. NPDC000555 TaxID=3154260 RepID=UPI00332EB305
MVTTTVTLPGELHDSLKQVAAAEHRSANATIVVAVAQYVQNHDKKAAVGAIAAEIAERHRELLDRLAK